MSRSRIHRELEAAFRYVERQKVKRKTPREYCPDPEDDSLRRPHWIDLIAQEQEKRQRALRGESEGR